MPASEKLVEIGSISATVSLPKVLLIFTLLFQFCACGLSSNSVDTNTSVPLKTYHKFIRCREIIPNSGCIVKETSSIPVNNGSVPAPQPRLSDVSFYFAKLPKENKILMRIQWFQKTSHIIDYVNGYYINIVPSGHLAGFKFVVFVNTKKITSTSSNDTTYFTYEGYGRHPEHAIHPNCKYLVTIQSLPMYIGENNQVNSVITADVTSPGCPSDKTLKEYPMEVCRSKKEEKELYDLYIDYIENVKRRGKDYEFYHDYINRDLQKNNNDKSDVVDTNFTKVLTIIIFTICILILMMNIFLQRKQLKKFFNSRKKNSMINRYDSTKSSLLDEKSELLIVLAPTMTSQRAKKSRQFAQLLSTNVHRIVTPPTISSGQKVLPSCKRVECNLWSMVQSLDTKTWLSDLLESAEEDSFTLVFVDHEYDVIKGIKELAVRSAVKGNLAKVVVVSCFEPEGKFPRNFPHMRFEVPLNLNDLTTELVRTIFDEPTVANVYEILEKERVTETLVTS